MIGNNPKKSDRKGKASGTGSLGPRIDLNPRGRLRREVDASSIAVPDLWKRNTPSYRTRTQTIPLGDDPGGENKSTRDNIARTISSLIRGFNTCFAGDWDLVSTSVLPIYDDRFTVSLLVVVIAREVSEASLKRRSAKGA
jgi:hypothetical protein